MPSIAQQDYILPRTFGGYYVTIHQDPDFCGRYQRVIQSGSPIDVLTFVHSAIFHNSDIPDMVLYPNFMLANGAFYDVVDGEVRYLSLNESYSADFKINLLSYILEHNPEAVLDGDISGFLWETSGKYGIMNESINNTKLVRMVMPEDEDIILLSVDGHQVSLQSKEGFITGYTLSDTVPPGIPPNFIIDVPEEIFATIVGNPIMD